MPDSRSPCWTRGRHAGLTVAMLDSRSPCWTHGRHVGLQFTVFGRGQGSPCWNHVCHVRVTVAMLGSGRHVGLRLLCWVLASMLGATGQFHCLSMTMWQVRCQPLGCICKPKCPSSKCLPRPPLPNLKACPIRTGPPCICTRTVKIKKITVLEISDLDQLLGFCE